MKDFDNFQSWAEVEGDYFSKFRKYPHFDNDYLWIKNKKLFSCGIFFYYSYYHFGRSFLIIKTRSFESSKKRND